MNRFILTLFREGDKLKGSSLYHLLKGKRSSSILLFGFFHDNLFVSGMYPKLTEAGFNQQLSQYVKQGLLEETAEGYLVTDSGLAANQQFFQEFSPAQLNFFRFGRSDIEAWRLLKFAVQVVSNLVAGENNYIPMESEVFIQKHIKHWLALRSREETVTAVYHELEQIFTSMDQAKADYLANQFSGYEFAGLVNFQLLKNQEKDVAFLLDREAVHEFLNQLEQHPDFILYHLAAPVLRKNQNQSMLVTQKLILEGYPREEVEHMRRLKRGTIQDHLLEWALQDVDFPYADFITAATIQFLENLQTPAKAWSYKELSQKGPIQKDSIDYFEFRLYQIQQYRKERIAHANQ